MKKLNRTQRYWYEKGKKEGEKYSVYRLQIISVSPDADTVLMHSEVARAIEGKQIMPDRHMRYGTMFLIRSKKE